MKVLHLSSFDDGSGAGRAAFRLHEALLESGVESSMWVDVKTTSDQRVVAPRAFLSNSRRAARIAVEQVSAVAAGQRGRQMSSMARFGGLLAKRINGSDADVVDMHWTGFGFMTIEEIGKITKPMVWTLHDMWAFLGADHYASDQSDGRWRLGYPKVNRKTTDARFDLDRWAWLRKQRSWTKSHEIVTPSTWLGDCVKTSALLSQWPVTVIPNPLNLERYQPRSSVVARELLGLPQEVPLILFGAMSVTDGDRKGWDLLKQALPHVVKEIPDVELLILGDNPASGNPLADMPRAHWIGQLKDDVSLSLAYSAASVTVVPSRMDNLPQSGTEAQACGCPVVAFNVSGLNDVISDAKTGFLAEPFDPVDLARKITLILGNPSLRESMSHAARKRAEKLWSGKVIAEQYGALYANLISR